MNAEAAPPEDFIEAQVAVVAVRLLVAGTLWCIAVALVDRTAASASDPYVANTRIALWLFLVEILIGAYYVRYTAATSYPLFKRAAFIVAESCTQAWQILLYTALNLAVRWVMVTLFTAAAIYLLGTSSLTRIAAILPSASFFIACLYGLSNQAMPPIIRGTHIGSYQEAISRAARFMMATGEALKQSLQDKGYVPSEMQAVEVLQFPWGGTVMPALSLDPHYLILGTTGSGKTLCVRMLLKGALRPLGEVQNRGLIYDGKREYYPLLLGMGIPETRLLIMNPADSRCVAWDMAKDVLNRDDAVNLTHILIPEDKSANENPFFIRAVRSLVAEAMMALHSLSPQKWRLIDLINSLRTPELMKRVLRTTREGKEVSERYFTDAKEAVGGIISTVDARFISDYETIARIWARCERSVGLVDWIKDRSILLLGYDANRQAVDRINQAIFQRASQLVCSLPEAGEGNAEHTWVVLDEVRFTGKLPMLPELISFGRTKNAHVVLAPQDLDGLIDVYGENRANELLTLCGNVGILRLNSPRTRDWASKFFGDYESWETETSRSSTRGGSSSSRDSSSSWSETWGSSTRRVKRESVLPSEFFNLPPTNRENGMHGFFATPAMGAWRAGISPAFIDTHLPPSDPTADPFIPRPNFAVDPVRWTKEEEDGFTRPHDDFKSRTSPDKASTKRSDANSKPPADNTEDHDESAHSTDDKQQDEGNDQGRENDPLPDW